MRRTRTFLAAFLLLAAIAAVAKVPERPYPQRLVNDLAGVFTSSQVSQLENRLVAFDDTTSNQIAVVTLSDLEGQDISMVAYEIGEKWGVGREKSDNGIVILIKPKTSTKSGQVFISVGYGLEGAIPDAITKRIVENEMIPHLRNGNDYYSAVNAALDVLMPLACGEISEKDYDDDVGDFVLAMLVLFLIAVIFLVFVAFSSGGSTNIGSGNKGHNLDLWDLIVLMNSGKGSSTWGGGSSRGGGFGGGFGGGGFGGFGGGHFGGAGAGGSW
ncbi:MAG: TPM domain-containing protein [Bacteroidales bacterium]|nr:TPM domain-containing protein [Bacteroidales bacterium]